MLLYALTIFLSAFLLFQVQPLIAKMILPWFGGSAAVWATCLLFFQTVLLLGYAYSHGIVERLRPKRQWMLHLALLGLCLLVLPIIPGAAWKPVDPSLPVWRILGLLAVTVGLPYFVLSTTGPLVQAWFVQARPGATPYRLYALSNLGSMLALLTYPVLIEPTFTLRHQAWGWSIGFGCFALLCAWTGWKSQHAAAAAAPPAEAAPQLPAVPAEPPGERPSWSLRLFWVALAACPSMLLLSLTSHLSMDVAPIPFLWILPLAIYLLSFILCFDAPGWYRRRSFLCLLPVALGVTTWLMDTQPGDLPSVHKTLEFFTGLPGVHGVATWMMGTQFGRLPDVSLPIALFSAAFFVCSMVCHGELSRLKPHPRYLTGFYLMLSIGGACGGVFVALLAPAVFNAYYEFPISVACCGAVALGVLFRERDWPFRRDLLGWPAIAAFCLAALLFGFLGRMMRNTVKGSLFVGRNFYGELRVRQYNNYYDWEGYRSLVHGSINHGEQYTNPARHKDPVTYYCSDTGVGRFMSARVVGAPQRVALIGLGTGTLAAYARPGDFYRFYEINPMVPHIANTYFTYLKEADAQVDILMGDARLSLERQAPQDYDLIALDAFSSDAIPVHLLTREALQLYFFHLRPRGVLAVHISNRYINLQPVLDRGAAALGKTARVFETEDNEEGTCYGTTWVLMASDPDVFAGSDYTPGLPSTPAPWLPVWTDDYSNLFKVLK
ncbi:MAG: spermidine synthase [Bryobacteraceae bacterium]